MYYQKNDKGESLWHVQQDSEEKTNCPTFRLGHFRFVFRLFTTKLSP